MAERLESGSKTEGGEAAEQEPDVSTIAGKIAAAEKLKQEGNALFKEKEFKKAIKKYRTVFAYVRKVELYRDKIPWRFKYDLL